MRKSLWVISALLLIAAIGAPTAVRASTITYTVNEAVGAGNVTGLITTDGNTGTLAGTDILDWNLILNDGTNPTFTLKGPLSGNNSAQFLTGSDLTATVTQLLFNFSGTDGGVLAFENPGLGQNGPVLCYETNGIFCVGGGAPSGHAITLDTLSPETNYVSTPLTGNDVIAAVIPEPSTLLLLCTGLLGVVGITRKKLAHWRQS